MHERCKVGHLSDNAHSVVSAWGETVGQGVIRNRSPKCESPLIAPSCVWLARIREAGFRLAALDLSRYCGRVTVSRQIGQ